MNSPICRTTFLAALLLSGTGLSGAAEWTEKVKVKTPDKTTVVELKFDGDRLKLEFTGADGQPLVVDGKVKDSGKRKFSVEGGDTLAEVKSGDGGFKLRTPDGQLLWKVKVTADKIKISDNEENKNAYELKLGDAEKIKVERNDEELGKVKFYPDKGKIKVKDAAENELFEGNATKISALYGVLLLSDIPEPHKYMIMAELLARGQ